jgi:ATP-dependent HslUV protease subunit HslV
MTRPLRLRLRGSLVASPLELVADESPDIAPPAGRALPEFEPSDLFDDEDPRGTALPVRGLSGGGVRTCTGGGGGGGALSVELPELLPPELVEPDEPELPDPELVDPDEVEPRGTAWAHAIAGIPSASVKRKQSAKRMDLDMMRPRSLEPGTSGSCVYSEYRATLLPRRASVNIFGFATCRPRLSCVLALSSGQHYDAEEGLFSPMMSPVHATTVLAVRHQGKVVMASDGQVTLGQTVVKHHARKVRRLYQDRVLAGFAGAAADGFALFSRFETKLDTHRGNLERAAVELARDWRADRVLRRLEAMLLVADPKSMYLLSGTGDLIEPDDGVIGIGSGGAFAMAAARALVNHSTLDTRAIVEQAMAIAADICVYTNARLTIEEI